MTSPAGDSNKKWIETFDNLLIPVAGALICVLCLSQALTVVPSVRRTVDQMEGRFAAQPTQAGLSTLRANMTLYISPSGTGTQPLALVSAKGQVLGELSAKPLAISVHEGEQIVLQRLNGTPSPLIVSVEYNSPLLVQPISGWSTTLTKRQTITAMPTIRFAR